MGSLYEELAEAYFQAQGGRLIGRNVYFKCGELDLVVELGQTLIFVEVRKRDPRSFTTPEESLLGRKSKRLLNAGRWFLSRYQGSAKEIRFDLVSFFGEKLTHHCDFVRE
jgi:putative endonuclease